MTQRGHTEALYKLPKAPTGGVPRVLSRLTQLSLLPSFQGTSRILPIPTYPLLGILLAQTQHLGGHRQERLG